MYVYVVYRCEPYIENFECLTYDSIYKAKDWIKHHGRLIGYIKRDEKNKRRVKYNSKLKYKMRMQNVKIENMFKEYVINGIPLYFIERHLVK